MSGNKSKNPFRPRAHRYALEPRQMYDGAALVEAARHADPAEAAHDAGRFHSAATEQPGHAVQPPAQPAPAPAAAVASADTHAASAAEAAHATPGASAPAPAAPASHEVYVVDESVANWQSLVAQLPKDSQVVVINDKSSGMDQLANALRGEHDISAIHIISHGASDSISLGTDTVTAANIASFSSQLGEVGATLRTGGDILVYGCDVSSHDTALVTQMATLTHADVASSTDATGAAALGGDWVLESSTGHIEARTLALDYDGLLVAPTVDTTSKTLTVSEPSTLNATGADRGTLSGWTITDDAVGGDVITVKAVVGDTGKGTLTSGSGGTAITGGLSFTGTRAQSQAWLNQLTFVAADVELGNTAAKTTITVTVTDAESLSASSSVDVTITPSNDPTTISDATKTVQEVSNSGGPSTTVIGVDTLNAIDPEVSAGTQTAGQIVYSLTALPQYGYLVLDGNRLGAGSIFTQQDVIDGKLSYVHTATGANQDVGDGFSARVNDGATPLASSANVHVTLNVAPVNQLPTVGGEGDVYEGQPANAQGTGNVGQWITADAGGDPGDTTLQVTITALPTHGTLYFNGTAVTATGLTFDYSQRNLLTYSNDGVDGVTQDSYGVRVTDQGGGTGTPGSTDGTIVLHVNAVDDDPALIAASTRDATVTQAGNGTAGAYSVVLTTSMIGATDVDSPEANVSFVTSQAGLTHGYLLLNGQELKDGGVFTMADVRAGRVQYVQTSGAGANQTDTFNFTVVDNTTALRWNADGTPFTRIGGDYTSQLQSAPLNNYSFNIHLVETQNGNGGNFPIHDPVGSHNGSTYAGVDPSGNALGTVDEGSAIILHGTTTNGQPTNFSVDPGLSYTANGVDPSQVVYTFLGFTNHEVNDSAGTMQKLVGTTWVNVGVYGTFTQADLDAGNVRFQHDGDSENFHVTANFSVTAGLVTIQNGVSTTDTWTPSFDIYVNPTNDAPVVTGSSNTVIAEGDTAYLTRGQLGISDPDDATSQSYLEGSPTLAKGGNNYAYNNDATGPNALKFIVTSLPAGGTLQYSTDGGHSWANVAVGQLIDASIITDATGTTGLRFVSNGSEVRNTSFTVEAQDRWGQRSATAGTVGIQITNVNDAPSIAKDPTLADPTVPSDSPNNIGGAPANEPLTVAEGGYAQITSSMLQAYDPDSSATQVQYAITTAPTHGNVAISTDGGVTFHILGKGSSFTQADVNAGRIYYLNDGTESTGTVYSDTPGDKFNFTVSDGDKEQAGNAFWIYTTPTNDAPTVTAPAGPVDLDSTNPQYNQVPGFSVADPDLTTITNGETDFIQVTVRLLNANGTAFSAADYANDGVSIGYATGAGARVDSDKNGASDYLVLSGTRAQVNAALAGLTVTFGGDMDAKYQVQVIADDRLRDPTTGALTAGANGGPANQSTTPGTGTGPSTVPVDATEYNWYSAAVPALSGNLAAASVVVRASSVNEIGTLTGPSNVTTFEDQATFIGGSFQVADPESAAFDTPITVTLNVGQGVLGIGGNGTQGSATSSAAGSRAVTISGDNSGTLVLTGRASDIQALLNDTALGLTYKSASNANHDQNGGAAGDVTLTVHFDDTGSKIGSDTGSGSQSNNPADISVAIDITPVNDAPTVGVSDTSTVYLNGSTAVGGFSVSDVDYTDGGGITTGETDFMQVTVRITDSNGNALAQSAYANITLGSSTSGSAGATVDTTFSGTASALVIRGTRDQVNAYLAGLQVGISGTLANADQSYKVQVIADDRLRDRTTGALDGSGAANGGLDNNAAGGTQNVPTTVVNPYAAIPGGLTANVASNSRTVFPSSINDPVVIGITAPNSGNESAAGVYTLSHITLADPDAGTAPISATVTLPTGFSVHDVNGNTGASGTYNGAAYTIGSDGQGHSTVTFTGTVAQVQAALNVVGVKVPAGVAGDNNAFWNGTFQVQLAVNDGGNHGSRPDRPTLDLDGTNNDTNVAGAKGDQYGYADGDGGTSNALVTTRVFDFTVNSGTQVSEAGLANNDASKGVDGTESFALFNDLSTVTLGNPADGAGHSVTLTLAQLQDLAALPEAQRTIQTANGTLVVTGYTPGADNAHGTLTYHYVLNGAVSQPGATSSNDVIAISTKDSAGFTDNGTITVNIVDDTPTARADTGSANEDSTAATGNVVTGDANGGVADRIGSDTTTTPVTGVAAGNTGGTVSGRVGTGVTGQYGTLILNADGSYSYTVDNNNATVNALKDNQSITDTYTYTITDADGDTSTTTLTITIHGHTDGTPSIVPVDGNGATAGQVTVHESGLVDHDGSQSASGTITLSALDGLSSVTIGGTTLTTAQLNALSNSATVSITTPQGTLVLKGFTATTSVGGVPTAGTLSYTYTLDRTVTQAGTDSVENISLQVTDAGGGTSAGTLTVDIVDDAPTAHADTGSVNEDGAALTGNVVSGTTGGSVADRIGADTTTTPVSGVAAGNTGTPASGSVNTAVAGQYGSIVLKADGSYTYTVDNNNATVNALKIGDSLTEVYTYTITDADGDSSTTTLTITIHGHTDGTPSIAPVDGNGAATGQATVHESGLVDHDGSQATTGTLTVTALDGLTSVTIGGTTLTTAQLNALSSGSPVSITTPQGTLLLTGFTATTTVGGVPTAGTISYGYTLDRTVTQAGTESVDNIGLSVKDAGGGTSTGTLVVDIIDDAPTAHADTGSVNEDGAALTGNVVAGDTGGGVADRIGADTTTTPVTGVVAGTPGGNASGNVGTALAGQYGSLTLNADGSYSYAVDNANATVNALKDGQTLTETYTYTITDADGDRSSTTLTITIHGHSDGTPSIVPVDGNGATAGQATVHESGLVDGDNSQVTSGTLTLTAADGLASVTVGGTTLTTAQLNALSSGSPVTIHTPDGTLQLTGFSATTTVGGVPTAGTLSYTYTLDHTLTQAGTDATDTIALGVTDAGGGTATGNLVVDIVNDTPTAHADTGDVNEDGAALTGNVVSGTTGGSVADRVGADTTATPVTGVAAGNSGGTTVSGQVASGVAGQYGTLTLNADGSYSYAVDNANATVNALKTGQTLTDTYSYTITDADGDRSTTTLTITIHGHTDGTPSIVPVDGNGAVAGQATVHESGLVDGDGSQATTGTLTVTAADGLTSVTIGGTTLTVAQLDALTSGTPVTIHTPDGTLELTGFAATTTVGGVPTAGTISYAYTLDHAVTQNSADSTDSIALSVTDAGGGTSTGNLVVDIVNDTPTAHADTGDVNEDGAALTGNVVVGDAGGGTADRIGADATTTPVTGVVAGTPGGAASGNVGSGVTGQYGTLTLNADGSYSYALDNANPTVNALKDGEMLTDTYTYTITDADGDASTTTLTITVHGHTDGAPSIVPVDGNGATAGQATVHESGLVDGDGSQSVDGSITLTAADGLTSVTIGGTTLTTAQLDALSSGSPVTIHTPDGTLVLTGFQATATNGTVPTAGTLAYTYTLDHAVTQNTTDSTDTIALSVTDAGGGTSTGNLVVDIVNDTPTAHADTGDVNEDGAVLTGNVVAGDAGGGHADRIGADATATPVTGVVAGTPGGAASGNIGSGVAGQYGTLVLNADGSYSYAVDNGNATVNALKDGQTLTDTYTYTITDADGDSSTTTLTITIHGHTDGAPSIDPHDGNGNGNGTNALGDTTVWEAGLTPDGPAGASKTATDTIAISAPDGLVSITVGGRTLSAAELASLSSGSPVSIVTPNGSTLELTGFVPDGSIGGRPTGGTLSYTYTLGGTQSQPGSDHGSDSIALSVTDAGGGTANGSLVVDIMDDAPTAHADHADVNEDGAAVTGNVVTGTGAGSAADRIGADATATPVSGVVAGNSTGPVSGHVGSGVAGQYGTLVLNADGSYSYAVDNANTVVNALKDGDTLTETYTYTITDADGDSSTTTLTITIHGHTDGTPSIVPVDGNGGATGQATVHESGLADHDGSQQTTGSIAITAEDGLASVSVGGTTLTTTQLGQLSGGTPVTIHTPDGTLVLTGFQPTATNGSLPTAGTLTYTYTLDHPVTQNTPDSVDNIALVVTDAGGGRSTGTLQVDIANDVPTAHDDSATILQDAGQTSASGNVFSGGDGADRIGADGPAAGGPVTGVVSTNTGHAGSIGNASAGEYGTLVLNADGTYSYKLDTSNPKVASLDTTRTLTEVFTYTITDADGDTSTATLTLTIHGITPPIQAREGDQIFPLSHEWPERDIRQGWTPGLFVVPGVEASQRDTLRWQDAYVTGRYNPAEGPLLAQDPSNVQYVLTDGVAFAQAVQAEADARSRVSLNDFALDHSPLWDDFSPFAVDAIPHGTHRHEADHEQGNHHRPDAPKGEHKANGHKAAHAAERQAEVQIHLPQVPVAIHVPPPASTPGGAPSLTAQIAAMAKQGASTLAAVPTEQPRH
ncbi:VCBS domain-containing protein [Bacillus sp. NP157]|nr:VCBS domain-containing protein [Bacillus sp. NP157]